MKVLVPTTLPEIVAERDALQGQIDRACSYTPHHQALAELHEWSREVGRALVGPRPQPMTPAWEQWRWSLVRALRDGEGAERLAARLAARPE